MRRVSSSPVVIAVLASLLGYSWAQAPGLRGADEPAKPDAGAKPDFPVAVVDLSRVFNGYKQLAERKEEQQRQFLKADESMKARVEELKRLQEEAKAFKEGSADQKRAGEELQAKAREFEAYRREQQKALIEAQSKLVLWAYERIAEQVQQYADEHGIRLVLQINAIPTEGKNPQEIMTGVNRQVIYHNTLDITDEILNAVN